MHPSQNQSGILMLKKLFHFHFAAVTFESVHVIVILIDIFCSEKNMLLEISSIETFIF